MQASNQDKMMAQLAELNDEIGADDWTIPWDEITRRKLIKQTPRHRVYKADWFGDVIVYEPIPRPWVCSPGHRVERAHQSVGGKFATHSKPANKSVIEHAEFSSKLNDLCLSLGREGSTTSTKTSNLSSGDIDCDQGVDSAYSSLSSTPQYYTKHNHYKHNEFQFPSQADDEGLLTIQQPTGGSIEATQVSSCLGQEMDLELPLAQGSAGLLKNGAREVSPVVLNRDSFPSTLEMKLDENNTETDQVGSQCAIKTTDELVYNQPSCYRSSGTVTTTSGGVWFELNELRLVAHENFILFMGASIGESARSLADGLHQTTSLVMQMSHPKSVSLHDLLHADKTSAAAQSPLVLTPPNRFFDSNHQHNRQPKRRPLTVETKLNICQQVTDAMTYLHDKNIVHARLTSVNVYLEPNQRVKVSLIDTDERQIAFSEFCADGGENSNQLSADQTQFGTTSIQGEFNSLAAATSGDQQAAFNLSTLTYLSPELVRTITVTPSGGVRMDTSLLTKEADVFAFGTLLFELFEERFPFSVGTNLSEKQSFEMPSTQPFSANGPSSMRSTSKLLHSLCLDLPTTPSPRSSYNNSFAFHQNSPTREQSPTSGPFKPTSEWNGNIRTSASELIYQIGSGQIGLRNSLSSRQKCPALVEHIISACWRLDPGARPSFKQLRFE